MDLEGIFGIYEETGTGVMEAIFYQMLLHEKSGRKLSVRLRYKEVWRNSEVARMKISL